MQTFVQKMLQNRTTGLEASFFRPLISQYEHVLGHVADTTENHSMHRHVPFHLFAKHRDRLE